MRADQFLEAVSSARNGQALDEVARLTYRALGEALLDDVAASAILEAAQARRRALAAKVAGCAKIAVLSRRRQVSPDRQRSIQRRRSLAASGALPPALAAEFTSGEQAALTIIAREAQRRGGACAICLDAISAKAGVSRSVVQRALRHGRRLGILSVQERRRAGAKSETNIVRICCPAWRTWLRIGCQNGSTTNINKLESSFQGFSVKTGKISFGKEPHRQPEKRRRGESR